MTKVTKDHMHLVEHILNDGWIIFQGDTEPKKPTEDFLTILSKAKPYYSPEQQEIQRLRSVVERQQQEITRLVKEKTTSSSAKHRFLDKEAVQVIRDRLKKGEIGTHIAKDLGIAPSVVSKIKTGSHRFSTVPVAIN
jgi:hypothetical protein